MSALRVLQVGAIAVVIAATTHREFDLDRFFVPKELVLHVVAALAGLLAWRTMRRLAITRVELSLLAFLLASVVSALFATNHWLALRALAISASGVLLFRAARSVRAVGRERALLTALAIAVVLAAVSSLLQAYGVWIELFATNRAPGGTLGNRNFVAHAAAFGLPVVLLAALRARTSAAFVAGATGAAIVTASLVLTRSRGAWLAFAAMAIVFLVGVIRSGDWRRFAGVVLFIGAGVIAALLIPNELRWRSDNPYLDSIRDVANYEEGSGRGRLIQYERSLRMALTSPLFGVGPGNWAVAYPEHAARRDPSLDPSAGGMTSNPWPSSDWVAFVAERGLAAAAALALAFFFLVRDARRIAEPLEATALIATIVAACVAGAFDAVLLLALPTLLVFTTLGALAAPDGDATGAQTGLSVPHSSGRARGTAIDAMPPSKAAYAMLLVLVVSIVGAIRSSAQLVAIELYTTRSDRASLQLAATLDPGNYRVRLRLARGGRRGERCEHALAALRLYPHADAARSAASGCDD